MNLPEMFYKVISLFFSDLWKYLGLLLIILTIRGDITKTFQATSRFFKRVADKYRTRIEAQKIFNAERIKSRPQK